MRKVYTYRLSDTERAEMITKAESVKMQVGTFIRFLVKRFKVKKGDNNVQKES